MSLLHGFMSRGRPDKAERSGSSDSQLKDRTYLAAQLLLACTLRSKATTLLVFYLQFVLYSILVNGMLLYMLSTILSISFFHSPLVNEMPI